MKQGSLIRYEHALSETSEFHVFYLDLASISSETLRVIHIIDTLLTNLIYCNKYVCVILSDRLTKYLVKLD